MIRAKQLAERVAIESCSQMIALIGDTDVGTRRLLEDILGDAQEHAGQWSDWPAT